MELSKNANQKEEVLEFLGTSSVTVGYKLYNYKRYQSFYITLNGIQHGGPLSKTELIRKLDFEYNIQVDIKLKTLTARCAKKKEK